jgi:hypothetical protein
MATGDANDFVNRLAGLVPASWFENPPPIFSTLLHGASSPLAFIYAFYLYTLLQSRISTATGVWLDIIAWDFFGPRFGRYKGEPDAAFSIRLRKEILRPRNTRVAIQQMLLDLTGNAGVVQEPWNPQDWGGYGLPYTGYGIATGGFGQANGYGSLQFRNQIFVKAVRPGGSGIPNVAGYGTAASGYGSGRGQGMYADISQITGPVTDAEIYYRISQIISAGITAWVAIVSSGGSNAATPGELIFIAPQTLAMEAAFGFFW